jgi:DNA polymerase
LINSQNLENWLNWQESLQSFHISESLSNDILKLIADIKPKLKSEIINRFVPEKTTMNSIAETVSKCQNCRLGLTRNKVVFGEGSLNADVMFIGEGPGADEDRTGRPFVGKAGQLLTKIIENGMKIPREQVYIANIVKCRPPGNRDPLPDEAAECMGYLKSQIDLIKPRAIILLGKVAAKYLMEIDTSISRARQNSYRYKDIPVFVTYHPSALLRNQQYKRPTWEDIQKVIACLEESEK